jgi:UPF0042 nucleotide-binding protein
MVTGISGAGKTQALHILEDMDYYCIDNLPTALIETFLQLVASNANINIDNIAIGIDIRSSRDFNGIEKIIKNLNTNNVSCEVVFLDAEDKTIIKRFKETKRTHPVARHGSLQEGITDERDIVQPIKELSNFIIDTTNLSIWQLKERIKGIFSQDMRINSFPINIASFGFKNGVPTDADMVFDVRFITNPYYVPELKDKTGLDEEVSSFVLSTNEARAFLDKLVDIVDYLIPLYIMEGKGQLTIAIGCTGGRHRSVSIANEIYKHLKRVSEYNVHIDHRSLKALGMV